MRKDAFYSYSSLILIKKYDDIIKNLLLRINYIKRL